MWFVLRSEHIKNKKVDFSSYQTVIDLFGSVTNSVRSQSLVLKLIKTNCNEVYNNYNQTTTAIKFIISNYNQTTTAMFIISNHNQTTTAIKFILSNYHQTTISC